MRAHFNLELYLLVISGSWHTVERQHKTPAELGGEGHEIRETCQEV